MHTIPQGRTALEMRGSKRKVAAQSSACNGLYPVPEDIHVHNSKSPEKYVANRGQERTMPFRSMYARRQPRAKPKGIQSACLAERKLVRDYQSKGDRIGSPKEGAAMRQRFGGAKQRPGTPLPTRRHQQTTVTTTITAAKNSKRERRGGGGGATLSSTSLFPREIWPRGN